MEWLFLSCFLFVLPFVCFFGGGNFSSNMHMQTSPEMSYNLKCTVLCFYSKRNRPNNKLLFKANSQSGSAVSHWLLSNKCSIHGGFVQLSSFYSSQCYRPLIKQMYKEAQLLNRLLVRWMEVANYNKRKRRRRKKKKNFILLGRRTFPFSCSSQRAGGTNGFLSVSLGSGGQFVSIKQDKTSFYFVGFPTL